MYSYVTGPLALPVQLHPRCIVYIVSLVFAALSFDSMFIACAAHPPDELIVA